MNLNGINFLSLLANETRSREYIQEILNPEFTVEQVDLRWLINAHLQTRKDYKSTLFFPDHSGGASLQTSYVHSWVAYAAYAAYTGANISWTSSREQMST